MAAFKFKLDFMIKLRQRKEEEAMVRLAKRLASIAELETEIADLAKRKDEVSAEYEGRLRAGELTAPLLIMYKEFEQKLAKELARLNEFLMLSRREEAKERATLAQASVDLKVMEKLKERQKEEHQFAQAQNEQNQLEEMAALAKARRDRLEAAELETNPIS